MGFFTKEPAEKKAFQKAFNAALSRQNEENFKVLEQACRAWPTGWQGYFLMGLSYDLAVGKIPFDADKAARYHQLTKQAGKAAQCEWLDTFYYFYNEYAGNFRITEEYFPRAMNIRKAAVAMMHNFSPDENHIITDAIFKGDLKFWDTIFSGINGGGFFQCTPEESQCVTQKFSILPLISAWKNHNGDHDSRIRDVNDMTKPWFKLSRKAPKEITIDDQDLRGFLFGCSLVLGGGAYDVLDGEPGWYQNLRIDGWMNLWAAANRGCAPALHFLAMMFNDEDFCSEICYAYSKHYKNAGSSWEESANELLSLLESAGENGDFDALGYVQNLEIK